MPDEFQPFGSGDSAYSEFLQRLCTAGYLHGARVTNDYVDTALTPKGRLLVAVVRELMLDVGKLSPLEMQLVFFLALNSPPENPADDLK